MPLRNAIIKYLELRREFGENKVYLPKGLPELSIPKIIEKASNCSICRRHGTGRILKGIGKVNSALMIIAETPEKEDHEKNKIFSGKQGDLLYKMIDAMKIPLTDIYLTYTIKCYSEEKPTQEDIDFCAPILEEEIKAISPGFLLLLGDIPAKALLKIDATMGSLRNVMHEYENKPVQATYSLLNLLNVPRLKKSAWEDLQKVMSWYVSEK